MLTPDQMNAIAQAQASKLRVVRLALPRVIGHGYVDIVRAQVARSGPPLEMSPYEPRRPIQMSAVSAISTTNMPGFFCDTPTAHSAPPEGESKSPPEGESKSPPEGESKSPPEGESKSNECRC